MLLSKNWSGTISGFDKDQTWLNGEKRRAILVVEGTGGSQDDALIVKGITFKNGIDISGGAIQITTDYDEEASVQIVMCSFEGNTANGDFGGGGAIYVDEYDYKHVTMSGNHFESNSALGLGNDIYNGNPNTSFGSFLNVEGCPDPFITTQESDLDTYGPLGGEVVSFNCGDATETKPSSSLRGVKERVKRVDGCQYDWYECSRKCSGKCYNSHDMWCCH